MPGLTNDQLTAMLNDALRLEKAGGVYSTPYVLDVCGHVKALAGEVERLKAELARYSMNAGQADHYRACAHAAIDELGLGNDEEGVAPADVRKAIRDARLLLTCKDVALEVFADPKMWARWTYESEGCSEPVIQWNGANVYADPVKFAEREMRRESPYEG